MTAFKSILNAEGMSDAQFFVMYLTAIIPAFLSELAVTIILTPVVIYVIKIIAKKNDIGDDLGVLVD